MGVYAQNIVFDKFPAILPRLCLVIFIDKITKPFKKIRAVLKTPESDDFIMNAGGKVSKGQNLHIIMVVSPFRANTAGEAKIEIYIDNAKNPTLTHEFLLIEQKGE